jgi:predicted RNA binding protein YcfA (HicA-like mRNA interferase family)
MKVREVIKLIEQDGWYLARTRGSHRQFKHPTKSGLVTIAGKPSDDAGTWHVKQHNDASSTKGTEANRRMRGNRANLIVELLKVAIALHTHLAIATKTLIISNS